MSIGRRVFLLVSSDSRMPVEAFESEDAAISWSAEHSSRAFTVYEVTGVRECTEAERNRATIARLEAELAATRRRLGVPSAD